MIKMILVITTMKMMITRHKIMVSINEQKSYYSDDADDDTLITEIIFVIKMILGIIIIMMMMMMMITRHKIMVSIKEKKNYDGDDADDDTDYRDNIGN